MRPVQYFSPEYLESCRAMSPDQIVQFLEDFRKMQIPRDKSRLISIKIPESLLQTFRTKCELENKKYQTQIKKLMAAWLMQEQV